MKKIIFLLLFGITATICFPQSMVVQKNDSSNLFIDLSTIKKINFIIPCTGTPTIDYAGKTYNTVQIGNQCWLKENLNVGTMGSPYNNGSIEKYCYNNVLDSCTKYGGLYMWSEAMQYSTTTGAQGICPNGWHLPTLTDVQALASFVENNGNTLKQDNQGSGTGVGSNTSGFSALLAGGKGYSGGPYQALGDWGTFWLGQQGASSGYGCSMQLKKDTSTIELFTGSMVSWGFSVRCVKN
jgi:uncharacterized protein (TIGR02145 family)